MMIGHCVSTTGQAVATTGSTVGLGSVGSPPALPPTLPCATTRVAQKQIHTATNPSIVIARFIVFSWFNCTQHAMPDLKSAFVPLILSHPLSRRIFNHFNDAASTAIVKNVLFFYICLWSLTSEPLAQLSRRG
jgi:hypothetical protein